MENTKVTQDNKKRMKKSRKRKKVARSVIRASKPWVFPGGVLFLNVRGEVVVVMVVLVALVGSSNKMSPVLCGGEVSVVVAQLLLLVSHMPK